MATTMSQGSAAAPTRDRHALTGRSARLDPRIDPVRADLTDIRLADRVFAPHYAMAMPRRAAAAAVLRAGPNADADVLSELLPGDPFDLLEVAHDVAWGLSLTDGVVGYVPADILDEPATPTHRVIAREAALREATDVNAVPLGMLPMGARVSALGERGAFLLTDHGYVAIEDVAGIDRAAPETLAAGALALLDASERRGGRSGAGVDAAGFVFLVHDRCGIRVPRFADLQRDALVSGEGDVIWFEHGGAIRTVGDQVVAVIDGQVRRATASELTAGGRLGQRVTQGRFV